MKTRCGRGDIEVLMIFLKLLIFPSLEWWPDKIRRPEQTKRRFEDPLKYRFGQISFKAFAMDPAM